MNKKLVTIEIDADGNSSIDLDGFQGKGCSKVAAEFRGPDTLKKSINKREYNIEQPVQQKVGQQ